MDVSFFKNRGRTWMGDICQKVEGMLHEVDGVIKQDKKNQSADQGKTSKMSMDDFFSEVIQGFSMVNPSSSDRKSATARKSPEKVEDKAFFINTDQLSESDDTTNSICNPLLDVDDKPSFIISEKSESKATIFTEKNLNHKKVSEPDTVNQQDGVSCVASESVEGEDGKTTSKEHLDMINDENFMSNKYDEVNNHFSIEPVKVKVEPFPFNEDRFDASVKWLEDNVEDTRGSRSGEGTEDHTLMQNVNAVYDQFLEETEGLLIPECTSAVKCSEVVETAEMGTKSITNHHDDLVDAVHGKFDISPSVGNTCADGDMICGFHSYKKDNMQIQIPSDNTVDDLTVLGMETVDLSDEVTLENSSSVINSKELYAVSHRVQKLRSFRKKIQDAFTTKRRLAKEYEQLAIWYGDIEIDCSKQYNPQISPSITVSSDAKNLQKHQSGDSEWVML